MVTMENFGIEIIEGEGRYIYKRNDIEKIIPGKDITFDLFPVSSSGIANYIQLSLKNPIVISPRDTTTFTITAPYDLQVRALKNRKWTSIDTIHIQKEKYALYGPVEKGMLCRYFKSDSNEEKDTAIVHIQVENETETWQEVSKIVFSADIELYEDEKIHYPPLQLTITPTELKVAESERTEGLKKIGNFIKDFHVKKEFTMGWGY